MSQKEKTAKLDSINTTKVSGELLKSGKKKGKSNDSNQEKPKRVIKLDDDFKTIGAYIAHLRKLHRSSIEEANRILKISIIYLKALEEDRLEVLPGGVYNESYIKSYVKYLGGDYAKAIDIYSVQTKKSDVVLYDHDTSKQSTHFINTEIERDNKKYLKKKPNAFVILSSIILITVVLYFLLNNVYGIKTKSNIIQDNANLNETSATLALYEDITFSVIAKNFANIKILDYNGKKISDFKLKPTDVQNIDIDKEKAYVLVSKDVQNLEFYVNGELFELYSKLPNKFEGKLISNEEINKALGM